jgi:very-short-patch-repair endonuclease
MALYQHLEGTQHLNPQLDWSNGAVFFQGRPLAAYQEKVQLFFKASGCKPGVVHYRLLTPAGVTRGANLTCCFCNDDYKYHTEQQVGRALLAAGLDTQTTWQCVPPGGGSVVDFYNFTAQLVIQADGTAHTQGVRPALKPSKLLQQDINKCVAAWHKGLKYMRVQHGDMEGSELLQQLRVVTAACSGAPGPIIILSPAYQWLTFWDQQQGCWVSYVEWLASLLGSSCAVRQQRNGWWWLQSLTR